ncbi:MAG TPA: hypothetical protein VFY71_05890 [Planctomycetota bacterium]|nr:hypothetical protein [Planctomycetota bacterium]
MHSESGLLGTERVSGSYMVQFDGIQDGGHGAGFGRAGPPKSAARGAA